MRKQTRAVAMALLVSSGLLLASDALANPDNESAPLVALLAPATGRALNANSLRVQALIAAVTPQAGWRFRFKGRDVDGQNIGRIRLVELAVDGVMVARVDPQPCRRQLLAGFTVDLTALAAGPHTLRVTARSGDHRGGNARSASAMFTLDPTLPFAEANEVEEIAVPEPFACFNVKGGPLQQGDGDDDDEGRGDEPWRRPDPFRVGGTLVTGLQSDRIDLTRDRIVVAVGSEVAVVEPGDLRCSDRGRDRIACRFADRGNPLVRRLDIRQKRNGRWQFEIVGGPLPADADTFSLRIGNDWGGIDLTTGERITGLRLDLDTSRRAQIAIGPDGGTIETTDSRGVRIRLDVPADALTADTLITMTPLSSSPLADSSAALHPGVKFEPEGLAFAAPATLTLDFSQTGQAIHTGHFIFLITSPLSTLPLLGARDPEARILTAQLPHFSTTQASPPVGSTSDFDLVRQIVRQSGTLSVSAIRNLLAYEAVWREQLVLGTLQGISEADLWILLGEIEAKAMASLDTHIANELGLPESAVPLCTPMVNPAREGVAERLMELEAMRQAIGAAGLSSLCYIRQNLEARINRAASATTPITPERRVKSLLKLAALAQAIGMFDLSDLAQVRIGRFLRSLLAQGVQTCQTDQTAGRAILDPLLLLAGAGQVRAIDPPLGADVQAAIANCGVASPFTIKMGTPTHPGFAIRIDGTGITWLEDDINENTFCCNPVVLAADQPPPVSLGLPGRSLNVTEPSPGVLAIDVTGSGASNSSGTSWGNAFVRADMVFATAGTLEIAIDPTWFQTAQLVVQWTLDTGESAFCQSASALFCYPGGNTTIIPITQPGARILDIMATIGSGNSGAFSASGRAVTITFTPQ